MAATASILALVALQLITRVSSFALSIALARGLGARFYGLANVQLQLISSSALFLSKEGLRRACQRVYAGGAGSALAHGMNLAWLSVPITAAVAVACAYYVITRGRPEELAQLVTPAEYAVTIMAVCAAAVVEAIADPGWLYAQANDLIGRRVLAEGSALVLKAAATAWLALGLGMGARAFGFGQLVFACVYVALLYALLSRHCTLRLLIPRAAVEAHDKAADERAESAVVGEADAALSHRATWSAVRAVSSADGAVPGALMWWPRWQRIVAAQYCWQSVQKYALTEGERVVLVSISPLAQQGEYALVSNLGSLVARLLLQPFEEVAFAHFSRAAAAGPLGMRPLRHLYSLLRGASIFGGVLLAFSPAYSWLLLRLLYGTQWSDGEAPRLLAIYSGYVCLMAINGVAEAFVNATASRTQLNSLASTMVVLSLAYVPAAALGLRLAGSTGLVLANSLSMLARISYAYRFARRAAADARATDPSCKAVEAAAPKLLPHSSVEASTTLLPPKLLPHSSVLGALAASALITSGAKAWLGTPASPLAHHACHVGIGMLCLALVIVIVLKAEPDLLAAVREARRKPAD